MHPSWNGNGAEMSKELMAYANFPASFAVVWREK
jgi:hypothetical protein